MLRPGDTVLDVNGNRISSAAEMLLWMQSANLDRPMQVTVLRDGEPRSFNVDVPRFRRFFEDLADEFEAESDRLQRFEANRPDYEEGWDEPSAGRRPALGVTLDARYRRSAIVARVLPDSGAAEACLRPGDRILSVNGRTRAPATPSNSGSSGPCDSKRVCG